MSRSPMIRAVSFAFFLATTAGAEPRQTMELQNHSSKPAAVAGVYEVLADRSVVDDNLGSLELIPPGSTITLTLGITGCTKVEVAGWLGAPDDPAREELTATTDLCQNNVLTFHD